MKLISEHLGEIIVALAGVALLISAIACFGGEVGTFFTGIVSKLTGLGDGILDGITIDVPELS